jgi:hypothetical protein
MGQLPEAESLRPSLSEQGDASLMQSPEDVLKKSETFEAQSEEMRSEQLRQFHIGRLRQSAFHSLFRLINQTPHLKDRLGQFAKHRENFTSENSSQDYDLAARGIEVSDNGGLRNLAPMFAALATDPQSRALLEMALDDTTAAENERIWSELAKGNNEVDVLVQGAGIHSAIYNAELRYLSPASSSLSVDSEDIIGGQFRQYGGPVLRMNSPNFGWNMDEPGLMTNPNSNSFGEHAPVRLTDLDARLFADSERVGLTAALNQYLSSPSLTGTDLGSAERVSLASGSKSRFRIPVTDGQRQEYIYSNQINRATGLGEATYGLPEDDPTTNRILDIERSKGLREKRVYTYTEILKLFGDQTMPSAMELFHDKRIGIVGGGHSGLTVGEALVGLGPEEMYAKSVSAFGKPACITIVGSRYTTAEEMTQKEYARYAQLSSLMPSSHDQKNVAHASLIQLIEKKDKIGSVTHIGEKSESDQLEMHYFVDDGNGGVIDAMEVVDIIISTVGFSEGADTTFEGLIPDRQIFRLRDLATNDVAVAFNSPGAIISYEPNNPYGYRRIEMADSPEGVCCYIEHEDGSIEKMPSVLREQIINDIPGMCAYVDDAYMPRKAEGEKDAGILFDRPENLLARLPESLEVPGAKIKYMEMNVPQLLTIAEVRRPRRNSTEPTILNGTVEAGENVTEFSLEYAQLFDTLNGPCSSIQSIELPGSAPLPKLYCKRDGELYPVARTIPGTGGAARIIGPAAHLELAPWDLKNAHSYRHPSNPVAIAMTYSKTVEAAALTATYIKEPKSEEGSHTLRARPEGPILLTEQVPNVEWKPFQSERYELGAKLADELKKDSHYTMFPSSVDYQKIQQFVLGEKSYQYVLPPDFTTEATVSLEVSESDAPNLVISFDRELAPEYRQFMNAIFNDPRIQFILYKTVRLNGQARPTRVTIP